MSPLSSAILCHTRTSTKPETIWLSTTVNWFVCCCINNTNNTLTNFSFCLFSLQFTTTLLWALWEHKKLFIVRGNTQSEMKSLWLSGLSASLSECHFFISELPALFCNLPVKQHAHMHADLMTSTCAHGERYLSHTIYVSWFHIAVVCRWPFIITRTHLQYKYTASTQPPPPQCAEER